MGNKGIIITGGNLNADNVAVGDGASVNVQQTSKTAQEEAAKATSEFNDHSIFFSYSWGGEGELFINNLYESLKADGYKLVRDKMDLGYKGLITNFMKDIGKGQIVIVCITDKYLRSEYCMYELYEVFRNCKLDKAELVQRIFPVNVENINLSRPAIIAEYLNYWNNSKMEWEALVKASVADIGPEQQLRYDRVKKIAVELGTILDLLSDMNVLTASQLSADNFLQFKSAINIKLANTD